MPELFRVDKLCHRFRDGREALKDICFSVEEGEFLLIAGRNGSGKTLLARHLAALSSPTSGRVLFRGTDAASCIPALRKTLGFVFQDSDAQILGQTVGEDMAFGPSNLGLSRADIKERTERALADARLSGMEDRRPETLSGGEKKRLAIAGVLAMRPACVILDEPFANLDLESVRGIAGLCGELKQNGVTLIVVTHELEKIFPLADRLLILDRGELRFDGTPAAAAPELFAAHGLVCPYEGFFPWTYSREGFAAPGRSP